MKPIYILAIESSCDETACAITKNGEIISNIVSTQIEVHQKYGGVMPEIASRLHLENILIVIKEAVEKANISLKELSAIAFTRGPGLIGALHVGLQAAKTLSFILNIPLIPVHHLCGHIYANEYVAEMKFPLLSVVVSGGNTELVYMKDHFDFEIIGETKDDAVGESFDKVARVLGLGYPGGIEIDKRAKLGEHKYEFTMPRMASKYDLSYSGLKTGVINLVNNLKNKNEPFEINDVCRSFQDAAIGQILNRVKNVVKNYKIKQILLAGGVSANSYLRERITADFKNSGIEIVIPPLWCTTDNAAMISKAAYHLYQMKVFADYTIDVDPSWKIEDYRKF